MPFAFIFPLPSLFLVRGYAGLVVGFVMAVLLISTGAYVLMSGVVNAGRVSEAQDFARTVRQTSDSTRVSIINVEWNKDSNVLAILLRNDGAVSIPLKSIVILVNGVYIGSCAELNCYESTPDGYFVPRETVDVLATFSTPPYRVSVAAGAHAGLAGSEELNNWISGCRYRRLIRIDNNSSSALSDFQIPVDLPPDFNYAATDVNGVMVAAADGVTALPFWIEYWNDSGNSRIWTVVDVTPHDSNYIFLYYGCRDTPDYNADDVFLHVIPDLVAYWPLDENSGSIAHDFSGNGHDMNIFGARWVSGWKGTAIYLDGGTDSYLIRNPFNGFPSSEITAYFWMETNDTGNNGVPISYASTATADDFAVMNYRNLRVYVADDPIVPGLAFNDGAWHAVAVTWKSVGGEVNIYDNGISEYSNTSLAEGNTITDGGSFVIGQDQDSVGGGFSPNQSFIGTIDEIMLFSRVLNPGEIQHIYSEDYFVSSYHPGILFVRRAADPEPSVSVGEEVMYTFAEPSGS